MNKTIFRLPVLGLIFFLALSCFTLNTAADGIPEQYVFDPVYLLDDQQYAELNSMAEEISREYECAVHIVITDDISIDENNIQSFSEDLYLNSQQLGYGDTKDGVMLVLSYTNRCVWVLAYGDKGNFAFTDYGKDLMIDNFIDNFSVDDWYGGLKDYLNDCRYYLSEAQTGKPVDIYYEQSDMGAEAFGFASIAGLFISLFTCNSIKSKMKTAVAASNASSYVAEEGTQFTRRHQQFLYFNESRTRIERQERSSESRGGTTTNRSGFSGKGRKF